MKRFYLTNEEIEAGNCKSEEASHMINVLRKKVGDNFIAFSGTEKDFVCEITELRKKEFCFKVLSSLNNEANPKFNISVYQALAKGEKLELITQKLTEIGTTAIYPLFVKNCDVKENTTKIDRLEKISISACKQCGRSIPLEIKTLVNINDLKDSLKDFDLILFANETENTICGVKNVLDKYKNVKNVAIIVGPEGGFTVDEIEKIKSYNAISVSLGSRILRTETASIYLASILSDFYGA